MAKFMLAIQARQHGNSTGQWVEKSRVEFRAKKEANEVLAVLRKTNSSQQYRGIVYENEIATGEILGTEAVAVKAPREKKKKLTKEELKAALEASGEDSSKLNDAFIVAEKLKADKETARIEKEAERRGIDSAELRAEKAKLDAEHREWAKSLDEISKQHREHKSMPYGCGVVKVVRKPETKPDLEANRDFRRYSGRADNLNRPKASKPWLYGRIRDDSGPVKEFIPSSLTRA